MKRMALVFAPLILFFLSASAHAQTLVTGTITDSSGYAYSNGQVTATATSPQVYAAQTDANGNFQMVIPAGTYSFTVSTPGVAPPLGTGRQQFTVSGVSISGTSQSLTTTLSNAALTLTHISGGGGSGTVTSIATTSPITGGTITTSGTIACATCTTAAASLTSGLIVEGAGGQAVAKDSNLDDGVTTANTLTYGGSGGITASAGPITAASDGTHAGIVALPGNTTAPSIPSNSFGFIGPASASFTSWFIQPSSTAPTAGCLLTLGAPSSNVSAQTCTQYIANTTFTNATTSVGGNACSAAAATVTMTGVTTSSVFVITPSTDISGSTGWGSSGGLVIDAWPTSNTLNYKICNQTSGSITPSAVTWNVGAK